MAATSLTLDAFNVVSLSSEFSPLLSPRSRVKRVTRQIEINTFFNKILFELPREIKHMFLWNFLLNKLEDTFE